MFQNNIISGVANEVLAVLIFSFGLLCNIIYIFIVKGKIIMENENNRNRNNNHEINNIDFQTDNTCSICLNNIEYELTTSCNHLFCLNCIIPFWISKNRYQLDCPICRRKITRLHFNFDDRLIGNERIKEDIYEAYQYNISYSNEPKTIIQRIYEFPFYVKRTLRFMSTGEGIKYILIKIMSNLPLICLLLYVLSPFDLIPEAIFGIFGLIDDFIIAMFIVTRIIGIYEDYLSRRERIIHQQHIIN